MNGIRAVVFDAVGTVIRPVPSAPVVYAEVGGRFGSRLTPAVIAERFVAAFQAEESWDFQHHLQTSEEREIRRWRHIVSRVLEDVSDTEACFAVLFEHFSRPAAWCCEPDLPAVLAELALQGLALGLASNYDSRLRSVAGGLPGLGLLGQLIISAEVGWRKPAPAFFEEVVRRMGRPVNEILYVGDDLTNDYEGARQAGLRAVLFDPRGKVSTAGLRRIERLRDLLRADP